MSKINFIIHYPYELNALLNSTFNEAQIISNYTSLLSDKDRFQHLITILSSEKKIIESLIGISLPDELDVYIIRAELFDSCSEPLLIEYQLQPEKMILHLLKEVIKNSLGNENIRFIDEVQQEQLLNLALKYIFKEIDIKAKTSFSSYVEYLDEKSTQKLQKKDLKYVKENSITISKDNSLLQIIEKSFENLY